MSNLEVEEVDIPLLDYNDSSNASAAGGSIGAISVSDRKWDDSATSGGSFADNRRRGGSDASVTANSTATSTSGSYIGYVRVQIRFEEDVESLYKNAEPLCVPPPPQEQISLERLRLHINRLGDLIAIFGDLQS